MIRRCGKRAILIDIVFMKRAQVIALYISSVYVLLSLKYESYHGNADILR